MFFIFFNIDAEKKRRIVIETINKQNKTKKYREKKETDHLVCFLFVKTKMYMFYTTRQRIVEFHNNNDCNEHH
jgi:hypothetical protein